MADREPTAKQVQAELWAICNRAVGKLAVKGQADLPITGKEIAAEQGRPENEARFEAYEHLWQACSPMKGRTFDLDPPELHQLDIIRTYTPITDGPGFAAGTAVTKAYSPTGRLLGVFPADGKLYPKGCLLVDEIGLAFLKGQIPWAKERAPAPGSLLGFHPFSTTTHMAIVRNVRSLVRSCYNSHRLTIMEQYGGLVVLCYPQGDTSGLLDVRWLPGVTVLVKDDVAQEVGPLKLPATVEILT